MKVSDYIVEFLAQQGVDKIFGYVGGNNAHLFNSIDKHSRVELINSRHEQASGFSAEGYARATSKTGVAIVTSGPGGTNLVTPIADCYLDSTPALFIVGDINSFERGLNSGMRQVGFQDVDIVAVTKPITKYSVFIDRIDKLRYELEKAYYLTQEGRKGAVVISIPVNFQYQEDYEPENEISFFNSDEYNSLQKSTTIEEKKILQVVELIKNAQKPVFLIGNGVNLADASVELKEFLKKTEIPIVHSLMGKDVIEESYKYNLGFIGRWGNRYGNLTLANSDLIIALGTRIDTLQTGRNVKEFAKGAKIVQVDIDRYELGARIPIDLTILGDVKLFLKRLNMESITIDIKLWQRKVLSYKERYPHKYQLNGREKLGNQIISLISKYSRENDIFAIDVGEHQMLSAQALEVKKGQRVLFSGGLGSMGFALPTAIGATVGTGQRAVVITGDGSIQMNIQELEVIRNHNLPIKIFIINNSSLYMVTTMQDIYLNGNHIGTEKGYSAPNFQRVGEAYGIQAKQTYKIYNIEQIIKESMESNRAEIIEIQLSGKETEVSPLLDYSRPFEDMTPHLNRDELREQMSIELV